MDDVRGPITRRGALAAGGSVLGAGLLAACGAGARSLAHATNSSAPEATSPLLSQTVDYVDPWHARVSDAGYRHKRARVGDVDFSYVEGPNNGPPLVLLHAQQMDWFSSAACCPPWLRRFTSSTSTTRDLVTAVLLEDPPLFSSEYPRIKQTIADRDFKTSDDAVTRHVHDFLLFWVRESKTFFANNFGPDAAALLTEAIKLDRRAHPGRPVELGVISDDTIRLFIRGMDFQYDPRFGAAFYTGAWNTGFDQAHALTRIQQPALLLQADYSWIDAHTVLDGAMSKHDAARAMSLLPHGTYRRVDSTHVVNLDKPTEFTRILEGFFLGGA